MEVVLPMPGTYIVAVSGGVDSRVLLDILIKQTNLSDHKYFIAHLDHGIRSDSNSDLKFVTQLAEDYEVPIESMSITLGPDASEERARIERYSFLKDAQRKHKAGAIITAHHQDDVLETAIINLMRGTGRKGLTSLQNHEHLLRPLLLIPKSELIKYAIKNKLTWREDTTNLDDTYLRNYVRHSIVGRLNNENRQQFIDLLSSMKTTNTELDTLLVNQLSQQSENGSLNRSWFNLLPHKVAKEMMASWLRLNDLRSFDSKTIERLVVAAKSSRAGQKYPIYGHSSMMVGKDYLALELAER